MKKLLLLIGLLCCTFDFFGQSSKLNICHKHMLHISSGVGSIQTDAKIENSPFISFGYRYWIRNIRNPVFLKNFTLQTGLEFTNQYSTSSILSQNQSFITIPIGLNYHIYYNDRLQFDLQVGLNYHFLLNNRENFNSDYFFNKYVGAKVVVFGAFGVGIRYNFRNHLQYQNVLNENINYSNSALFLQYNFRTRSNHLNSPKYSF